MLHLQLQHAISAWEPRAQHKQLRCQMH